MTTRMKITNQGPENAAIWYYGSDRMFKEQKDHLTPGQSVEVDIWDGHLPVLLPMGHTPPGVGESGKFFRCPPATYSSDAAAQPQQDEPDDDQEWDRNAERLTKEAFGLGGGINPNATSIDDLFLDDEPEPPNPALAKAAESHARLIQQDEPVAWGQLGLLNGKTYLRMNYDRTPYPPPADVVRNLNLVPLYAAAQPQQANAEDEKVINVRPSEWAALSPEARGVLRRLVFAARTAGGTAGHDQGLTEACDAAEALLLVEAEKAAQPQQAADLDALRRDNDKLRTVMIAAAEEIQAHWDAHCDSEGYGPVNLRHRLEEGIPSEYGYTAGAFAALKAALSAAVDSAVAAERERCAALCEMWNTSPGSRLAKEIRGAAAQPPQAFSMKTLVDRFLTWPVPAEVYPDGTPGQPGRTGTNLLNAQQAQAMLEHVLAAQPQQAPLKERPDFVAGYDAGLADGRRIAEREQAAQPGAQEPRVCWLVEEFSDSGNSTGRYMQDQNGLTITTDVQKARRFRRSRTATFRATDMREKWGTAWRPVSHLFASAQPQQAAPCDEEIGWLIEHRAAEHTLWWSGEFCPADDEYRSVRLIARMSNDANNAVRFVRKEDAQRVLDAMLAARPSPILARAPELYSVTEHMWTAAAQPPQD